MAGMLTWLIIAQAVVLAGGLAWLAVQRLGGSEPAVEAGPRPEGAQAEKQYGIPLLWTNAPLGPLDLPEVIISKSARVMTILDAGQPVKSYRVAVGPGEGDKKVEGDRCTPEGDFYICIRKDRGETPYTRSLGLSYPNIEDARRGLRDGLISQAQHDAIVYAIDRAQLPPWDTPLGGAIMIHGKKDGRATTLGCIAVEDPEILEIFPRLPLGTRVAIVP